MFIVEFKKFQNLEKCKYTINSIQNRDLRYKVLNCNALYINLKLAMFLCFNFHQVLHIRTIVPIENKTYINIE